MIESKAPSADRKPRAAAPRSLPPSHNFLLRLNGFLRRYVFVLDNLDSGGYLPVFGRAAPPPSSPMSPPPSPPSRYTHKHTCIHTSTNTHPPNVRTRIHKKHHIQTHPHTYKYTPILGMQAYLDPTQIYQHY